MRVIWKREEEELHSITFNDNTFEISCDWDKTEKNKSMNTIVLKPEVYEELKRNIPVFITEQNINYTETEENNKKVLKF